MKFKFFFTVIALTLFSSCATSPTGRKQIMLLPDEQINSMGVQSFNELKSKEPKETDPAINAYVKCVAMSVALETDASRDWEVVVFRNDAVNAFALPGGKIGVYTGLLKVAKTQDQLAAVLGHEVGHVIAKHGNERVSENILAEGGLVALNAALKNNEKRDVLMAALGLGTQVGVLLPHGRSQESEADIIGIDLMARAGFDPHESVELWKNMSKAGGGGPPEFLSTHPANNTRIQQLEEKMPEAMNTYTSAKGRGRKPSCNRPQL